MNGTLALTRAEVRRLGRNKRYSIFSVALPGRAVPGGRAADREHAAYGVGYAAYYMIAMASIGAFSGALTGNAQRISQERKDGWIRQLRLTSLPANAYVIGKVIGLDGDHGAVDRDRAAAGPLLRRRPPGRLWKWLAIAGTIWLGSLTFAALAVAIGYRFTPDQVQPDRPCSCTSSCRSSAACGSRCPASSGRSGKFTPTYDAVKIGTDVIGNTSVPAGLAIGLVVWLGIFVALATWRCARTAETV